MKRVSFLEIIIVKKQFKWILGVVLFILLAFSAYSTWFYLSNKPPETEIILAGKNIALAQKSSARAYSPEKLSQANSLLEQAMQEWKTENDKMFLFRDYTLSRELALKANELAIESGNEAGENSKGPSGLQGRGTDKNRSTGKRTFTVRHF